MQPQTNTVNVLDHGFVTLRNLAGPTRRPDRTFDASDIDPAQAARMSFEQMDSERTYEQDMRLAKYLLTHGHTSPFEMVQVWVEVKVPIFVDRQMVRHRTWSRNESSGRYITLPEQWYIPDVLGAKATDKKQGRAEGLDLTTQARFKELLHTHCRIGYRSYLSALNAGVAPEQARMFLSLNHYVHWVGTVDLSNMFKFLALRLGEDAQWEARQYAQAIVTLLRPHLPGLMQLFDETLKDAQ